MDPNSAQEDAVAAALADAYALNRPSVATGFARLASIEEAAEVQAAVARRLGARVSGWKIGYTEGVPVAAPIMDRFLKASGAHFPMREPSFWGVEPEIAVRLGADLPRRIAEPYTREEVLAAIDTVLVGIEVVGSRIIDHKAAQFLFYLADNIGHAGYAVGTETRQWQDLDLANLRVTMTIGGGVVHDGVGGHPTVDPLKPLIDYANAQSDRLGGLRAGQIVTTGSLAGLVPVGGPGEVTATIDRLGDARLYIHG